MFAGHVGAARAIGRVERRINVGWFFVAALLLDLVLWLFVLPGRESVVIPADFVVSHQPRFVFPYSHGLVGSSAWSALAGAVVFLACRRLPQAGSGGCPAKRRRRARRPPWAPADSATRPLSDSPFRTDWSPR